MFKRLLSTIFMFSLILGTTSYVDAQSGRIKKRKKKKTVEIQKPKPKPKKPKKGAILPYNKVVTKEMKTDDGLFKVHSVDDKYLFEVPDSLINREMLMVTRIAKTANGIGFGGGKTNTQVLRWKRKGKKILLRVVSHNVVADTILPIHEAVVNSNFEPVLFSFPIKAFNKDTTAVVIDATSLFSTDVKPLGFPQFYRSRYKISRMDKTRSYIDRVNSYPKNIEIRHVKTYFSSKPPSNRSVGSISVEMSNSMVLLPKVAMKRRYFDERVGWFARGQVDYGLKDQRSKTVTYLDRWRLEVKEEDIDKFKAGELVEPKKQIVYYIDRATPEVWREYIKKGIEDWQVAFEAAGFKNAIIAKDPPSKEEDPDWSPEDVRYSVVRYLASPIPNANGPHVSDPRSGEILESDINWYHNVMSLLRNWFFIQTAAINPEAQTIEFKEEVMGRLIRFVSSHEVGHTLGLPHNMGSSAAYPVDSLRSASFTNKFGTAPSIMDYARFNYIAQPEDGVTNFYPRIGEYDDWSIEFGYRLLGKNVSVDDEEKEINEWILSRANDPVYRFGRQQGMVIDPTAQTEDLGHDAIKASDLGIENLKRIKSNLLNWGTVDGEDYSNLDELYKALIGQFSRYLGHVSNNIGGIEGYYKTADQEGPVYVHTSKEKQKRAMDFMDRQLFNTPYWIIDTAILDRIEASGNVERIGQMQSRYLNNILLEERLLRLIENESENARDAYTISDLMKDLRNSIWNELTKSSNIDVYRRNLQKSYVERLEYLIYNEDTKYSNSDIPSIARASLFELKNLIKLNINKKSGISKDHLNDILNRIEVVLENKKFD